MRMTLRGELGNDILRERAYLKARAALAAARALGREDANASEAVARFSAEKWFFVPLDDEVYAGAVIPVLAEERVYDLGWRNNLSLMVGRGSGCLGWLLPWKALQDGMSTAEASVWPVSPAVKLRLEEEAERMLHVE